jgi:DNA-directed RNA polymerase subunit RPC12/RpoP
MDYRCPHCGRDLATRKLSQPIVARMEVDCRHCKRRIRVNVHRVEEALIIGSFAAVVLLAALGYLLDRQGFYLGAFAAAMLGAAALPLAERLWLRTWPRYAAIETGDMRNSADER